MRDNKSIPETVQSHLPVLPKDFHILFSLAREARYGYAIVKDIEERSGGAICLEPGNLYRSLQKLIRDGLIERTEERPTEPGGDERRRYYLLTRLGDGVLRAEAERMRALVQAATSAELIAEG